MDQPLHILLLEDNLSDVMLLEKQLKKSGMKFLMHVADTRQEFLESLYIVEPDVVLSDHSLPSFNSLEAMKLVRECNPDLPFILVTGAVSEDFAVQCMKQGADDYILKSSLTRLPAAIENCLARREISREKKMIESLHAKLQSAYNEIEAMNKDMTDSIMYASRIQEAMLPQKELLEKYSESSCIFYRPKDIVSGDFYWFNETDNKLVVAVADCTGHGVPGALMSVIGNNLLNEIVIARNISASAKILDEMNKGIRKLLRQHLKGNRTQDGMDVSICVIDRKRQLLEFSAANHRLFLFRNNKPELIRGDRKSIGGYQANPGSSFTSHLLHYRKGDAIYMFSDGYADQFGGRNEKRMQTKNLIKLLQSTLSLGVQEQEQLLNDWLLKWKGNLKQTDDILLIGMQF